MRYPSDVLMIAEVIYGHTEHVGSFLSPLVGSALATTTSFEGSSTSSQKLNMAVQQRHPRSSPLSGNGDADAS